MSEKIYRDLFVVVICRICGMRFRPPRGDWRIRTRLCAEHREGWFHEVYMTQRKYKRSSIARQMNYAHWKIWVINNLKRRQATALASYHRRKHLHKARKHRATKKPAT